MTIKENRDKERQKERSKWIEEDKTDLGWFSSGRKEKKGCKVFWYPEFKTPNIIEA